jgi:sulfite oxidase
LKIHNKHPSLIVREETPLNAGAPLPLLRENFITAQELFFVRNHAPVPEIDEANYRLNVGGMTKTPLQWTLADIKQNFPRRSVTATLQCAGNRRDELAQVGQLCARTRLTRTCGARAAQANGARTRAVHRAA